jgi:glycosyltransferase involved in cell wall biosynthesis
MIEQRQRRVTFPALMFGPVAIVHDWLTSMRGGERVVEALCGLFPEAAVFTLRCDRQRLSPVLARRRVTTSFIDRVAQAPLVRGRFRGMLPLFPMAIESFKLDGFKLVISSSHCVATGALAPQEALHVAYVHSPMRYVREGQATYEQSVRGGRVGRLVFKAAAHYLRMWDATAGARPDVMIANSTYTSERIRRYYQRDSEVIAPPIETRRFEPLSGDAGEDAPFLLVSALVPNKRVELAVQAMAGRRERLVVVGEGSERRRLERLAGPNVSFRGWVSDPALDVLYGSCRGLLHPGVDDFGMVMAEALAAGKPVIAAAEGGAPDIVRSGDDGLLFDSPTVESLRGALDRFALMRPRFEPARLRARARRFDRAVFERRFLEVVENAWRDRAGAPVRPRRVEGRS